MAKSSDTPPATKRCGNCGKRKARSAFYKHARMRDGLFTWCRPCWTASRRDWQTKNRQKLNERSRAYRQDHLDEMRQRSREYYAAHRTQLNARKREKRLARYGLTLKQFACLLRQQKGVCAICARPPPKGKRLHVDHDHATGAVRGLLCIPCNTALGKFEDDVARLHRAIQYICR